MKQITISGYLGNDAVTEQKENYVVVKLNVATSEKKKNATGEVETKTDWFTCYQTYNQIPKNLEYLKKGQKVLLNGRVSFNKSISESGVVYFNKNIRVDLLEILFDKKDSA